MRASLPALSLPALSLPALSLPALSGLILQLTLAQGPLPVSGDRPPAAPPEPAVATQDDPPQPKGSGRAQKETGVPGSASAEARRQLAALSTKPDPSQVDAWTKLLREPDPGFRRQVVVGLIRALPDHAFDALAAQLDSEHPSQREAARYGIGMTGDPRVAEALLSRARLGEPLDPALIGGLRMTYRPYLVAANERALGIDGDFPETSTLGATFARIRDHVGTLWKTPGAHQTETLWRLAHRLADHAVTRAVVETFLRGEPFDEPRDRELFRRFCTVNALWLGRPPHPESSLTYDFHMENHATSPSKTKEFRLTLDSKLAEALRCLHNVQVFGRGTRLELPLDDLLIDPARRDPAIRWNEQGQPTIEYRVRAGGGLVAAIGSLNTSYWLTRVANADRSVVELEAETGTPRGETIYAGATEVARIRYENFVKVDAGRQVPGRIVVTSLQPTNFRDRRFETTLEFSWLPEKLWLFRHGNVIELERDAEGKRLETLRASGRIDVVRTANPDPKPGAPGDAPRTKPAAGEVKG